MPQSLSEHECSVQMSLALPAGLYDRLEQYARETGQTRTGAIRQILLDWFACGAEVIS